MEVPIEKRRFDRIDCRLRVQLQTTSSGSEWVTEVFNISVGGMLCATRHPLARGETVRVSIDVPNAENEVWLQGEVRHVSQSDTEVFLHGVQFLGVENLSLAVFESFVESLFA